MFFICRWRTYKMGMARRCMVSCWQSLVCPCLLETSLCKISHTQIKRYLDVIRDVPNWVLKLNWNLLRSEVEKNHSWQFRPQNFQLYAGVQHIYPPPLRDIFSPKFISMLVIHLAIYKCNVSISPSLLRFFGITFFSLYIWNVSNTSIFN